MLSQKRTLIGLSLAYRWDASRPPVTLLTAGLCTPACLVLPVNPAHSFRLSLITWRPCTLQPWSVHGLELALQKTLQHWLQRILALLVPLPGCDVNPMRRPLLRGRVPSAVLRSFLSRSSACDSNPVLSQRHMVHSSGCNWRSVEGSKGVETTVRPPSPPGPAPVYAYTQTVKGLVSCFSC